MFWRLCFGMVPAGGRPDLFVDAHGAHKDDDEAEESGQAPGPAHILSYYHQHNNSYEEDSGNLIPDPQALGRPFKDALHLLLIDGL